MINLRQIPYGEANFEAIRTGDGIYVDKTKYIEKLEQGFNRKKVIYLRPRRFGKSLFTDVLNCYYSVDMAGKFENLFKGLYIYENPTKNKNNYYVLKFNFSGMTIVGGNIVKEGKRAFRSKVKNGIEEFINRYKLNIEIEGDDASEVLANLLTSFNKLDLENKIYIMIDEYDNFTNAILKADAKDFLDLVNRNGYVRAFYEVIKEKIEQGIVDRFFATGVMPVTLDNLTSGFNIATNLSTDPEFSSMIGFTHEEVRQIVEEVVEEEHTEEIYNDLKENYDGYKFSKNNEEKTFNSTLVMYYLSNYVNTKRAPDELLDVNMNTSGDKITRMVELVNPAENYKAVEEILFKGEIQGVLKNVVLDGVKFSRNDFLTMLFHLGYVTIAYQDVDTVFKIPNNVTETIYSEYMIELIREQKECKIETENIRQAVYALAKTGDIRPTVELIKDYIAHCSNRDAENFNEKMLKYTFAMFLSLSNQYIVYGEYPAKQGFADILIQKTSASRATYEAVIELKYLSKEKGKTANKEKLLQEAEAQLARYMEDKRLNQRENLKKYVIIFTGFDDVMLKEL